MGPVPKSSSVPVKKDYRRRYPISGKGGGTISWSGLGLCSKERTPIKASTRWRKSIGRLLSGRTKKGRVFELSRPSADVFLNELEKNYEEKRQRQGGGMAARSIVSRRTKRKKGREEFSRVEPIAERETVSHPGVKGEKTGRGGGSHGAQISRAKRGEKELPGGERKKSHVSRKGFGGKHFLRGSKKG